MVSEGPRTRLGVGVVRSCRDWGLKERVFFCFFLGGLGFGRGGDGSRDRVGGGGWVGG